MPMLTRPLTAEEVNSLAGDKYRMLPSLWPLIIAELNERDHQMVLYRAAINRVDYERRDTFYVLDPVSPSDCHWMVPCGNQ